MMTTKSNIKIMLFFLSISMVFVSCNDDNVEAFDTSAAERIDKNLTEIKSKLASADQGWVFEYFPHREQNIGGYNFIVKFDDKESVEAYSESQTDFTTPVSSLYGVIARAGSVLTFHTNNELLHEFATPSSAEYQAKGGDYEFTMSSIDDNTLKAKGVVTGNDMFLRKLTVTPQEYLTKVSDVSTKILGSSLFLNTGSGFEGLPFTNRNITFPKGTVGNEEDIKIAVIFTPEGVRFYEPIMLNGVEVSELTLNSDQLVNTAGNITIELVVPPVDMSRVWTTAARLGFMPQAFIDIFAVAKTLHDPNFGGRFPLDDIFFLGNGNATFSIGTTTAVHGLNFSGVPGEPSQLTINRGAFGRNWTFVPSFQPMIDILISNSPYEVDLTNPARPVLTSVADPTFVFSMF